MYIFSWGERGHSTLNHIVVHYIFIHDLNNVASKTKHESKIVRYLKSEIKHPPCSAGPDFDYSSRVSTQCWHLHSYRFFVLSLKFFQHKKKKHVLNWESGDGSDRFFVDLNLLVLPCESASVGIASSRIHLFKGAFKGGTGGTRWNLSPWFGTSYPIPLRKLV